MRRASIARMASPASRPQRWLMPEIVGVGDQQRQPPPLPMSLDQPERELLVEVPPIERPHQQIHHDGFLRRKADGAPALTQWW